MRTNLKILTAISLLTLSVSSFAETECAKDNVNWLDKVKFQEDRKKEGYDIKVFKVTKGNCYEIYGKNKEGKRVEIYYHPVTGEIVKSTVK